MPLPLMPKLNIKFTGGGISILSVALRWKKAIEAGSEAVEMFLAEKYLEQLKQDLKSNNLGLKKLRPTTIKFKELAGQSQPSTPLYGRGESDSRSLISGIVVSKTKARGVRVEPSRRKTHHSGVRMARFITMLAEGYTTKFGEVPPRDVMKKAYNKFRPKAHKFAMVKKLEREIRKWK